MKNQPKPDYISDDRIMTPPKLALDITEHFKPSESLLEPCRGTGNFYAAFRQYSLGHPDRITSIDWCEINEGKDFYVYSGHVSWIITNPPYSKLKKPNKKSDYPESFLVKMLEVSDNVVALISLNHLMLSARINYILDDYKFDIKELILLPKLPLPFPQSGFQLGVVHLSKNKDIVSEYFGGDKKIKLTDWRDRKYFY